MSRLVKRYKLHACGSLLLYLIRLGTPTLSLLIIYAAEKIVLFCRLSICAYL